MEGSGISSKSGVEGINEIIEYIESFNAGEYQKEWLVIGNYNHHDAEKEEPLKIQKNSWWRDQDRQLI